MEQATDPLKEAIAKAKAAKGTATEPAGQDPLKLAIQNAKNQAAQEAPDAAAPPFSQRPQEYPLQGASSITPPTTQPAPTPEPVRAGAMDQYTGPDTTPPGGLRPFSANPEAPRRQPQMMPTQRGGAGAARTDTGYADAKKLAEAETTLQTYRSDFTPQAAKARRDAMAVIEGNEAADAYMAEEIARIKTIELPKRKQVLEGMKAGFSEDNQALEFAMTDLNAKLAQYEDIAAQDPSQAPALQAQYEQELAGVRSMQDMLEKQRSIANAYAADVERDQVLAEGYDYLQRSRKGTFGGATWNNILNSVGSNMSGINAPILSALLAIDPAKPRDGETQAQADARVKRSVLSGLRGTPKEALGTDATTEEYTQKLQDTFLGGAWLSGTGSLASMAAGGGIGLMAQAADGVRKEMEDESFDNVPEWKKELFANSVGLIIGQLEKYGIQQAVGGGKMAQRILAGAMSKLPQNATTAQIKAVIMAETESAAANFAARTGAAALSEGATEFQQGIIEPAMKDVFNMAEEKNLLTRGDGSQGFDTPDGLGGYVSDALYQAAQGAVIGGVLGTPSAVLRHLKDRSVGKTTNDTQFELTEELLKDPEFEATMKEDLARKVKNGNITETQAKEIEKAWKEAQAVVAKIPDNLSTEKKREAFDLLTEKQQLSKLDKALVGDKVMKIDEKLAKIAGVEPEAKSEMKAPASDVKPAPPDVDKLQIPRPYATIVAARVIPENRGLGFENESVFNSAVDRDFALFTETMSRLAGDVNVLPEDAVESAMDAVRDSFYPDGGISPLVYAGEKWFNTAKNSITKAHEATPTATQADIDAATGVTEVVSENDLVPSRDETTERVIPTSVRPEQAEPTGVVTPVQDSGGQVDAGGKARGEVLSGDVAADAIPPPVEPAKPEPKKPQTAGDRLRAKKIDVSKLGDMAFSLPLPVPVKTLARAVNASIEIAALALDAGDSVAVALKKAKDAFQSADWYKNLDIGGKQRANAAFKKHVEASVTENEPPAEQPPTPQQPEKAKAEEGVKKTFEGVRVYEGAFREEVRAEVRKLGLFRQIESREEAKEKARKLIETVGIDAAADAVRNHDVEGGAGAYIWDETLRAIDKQIGEATDATIFNELVRKQAEMIEEIGRMQLSYGRFNSAWGDIQDNSDLGYSSAKKAQKWEERFGEKVPDDIMEQWKKRDEELAVLNQKLKEAEKRAEEAEAQAAIKAIAESISREEVKNSGKTYTRRSKDLANAFRKLKTKPMVFLDADGKPIEITKLGSAIPFDWNQLIEAGAQAIELAGKTADIVGREVSIALEAMSKRLKQEKWFNDLDNRNKRAIMQQLEERVMETAETFGEERIKIPVNMIRAAVAQGAKDIDSLVAAIKEQVIEYYPDATDREIRDAITGYGRVVNMSKDEISVEVRKLKDIGRIISALEDIEKKIRPMRSGLQRDKMDAQQRMLHNKLREAMKTLPPDSQENERVMKTALEAAKTRARNRIEDLQREIDTKERAEKKAGRLNPDDELKALIKERDILKEEHERVFGPRVISEETRLKTALDSIRRSVEEYERRIAANELDPQKPAGVSETPELRIAREGLTKVREEYKKLQDETGVIDRRRTEAAKKATKARIAELERRIAEKDFSKKEPRKTIADDELTQLRAEKERIKEEYDKDFYREMLKQRTRGQIARDLGWDLWGFMRAIKSTAEVSFILLQGGVLTVSNLWRNRPALANAFKASFDAFKSEKKSEEWLMKVRAQPWYQQAKEAKLAITEPHAELTAREELFMSDWTRLLWKGLGSPLSVISDKLYERWIKANPMGALERAAAAYLSTLRIERYLEGVDMLEQKKASTNGQEVTAKDYKDLADAVNTLTGRGSLGALEPLSSGLTKIFYSPRMWSSAMRTATPYGLIYFSRLNPTARKIALLDMARFIGTTMGFVSLAGIALAGDDDDETYVETDPRSSDFGKIRLGDIRVDPWGGRVQQVVMSVRLALGTISLFTDKPIDAYKSKGKLMPLGKGFGTPTLFDVAQGMVLNKLAPSASLVVEAARTTLDKYDNRKAMYQKEPYDFVSTVMDDMQPIYFETIEELTADDPGALEGLLIAYAFFGGGVSVYGDKKKGSGTSGRANTPSPLRRGDGDRPSPREAGDGIRERRRE